MMRDPRTVVLIGAVALALTACGEQAADAPAAPAAPAPAVQTPAPTPDPAAESVEAGGRTSRYTELKDCKVIVSRPDEGGYSETECAPVGGFGLKTNEADVRQNVFIKPPGGQYRSLRLVEASGGGFSRLGEKAEWRGVEKDGVFTPDVMVVRQLVVEDPNRPEREAAYLAVIRLSGPGAPCLVERVPAGPGQSDKARALADSDPACRR